MARSTVCVFSLPAPLTGGNTAVVGSADAPPCEAAIDDDRTLVDIPIDFGDDTPVIPGGVTKAEPEGSEEAPDLTDEVHDRNQINCDGDDDDTDPPAGALAVRPPAGGDGPTGGKATIKLTAAGQPYTEDEARLVVTMTEAIHRSKVFEADLDDALFEIGRCAHTLHEECNWTLRRIGQAVNYSESRISQLRSVYLAFPTPESRLGMNLSVCEEARQAHKRLSKNGKLKLTPTEVLHKIKNMNLKSQREVTAHINKEALKEANEEALVKYEAALAANPTLFGSMHNRSCLDVLDEMGDGTAKLLWADPPYAQFIKVGHEGYVSGRESSNGLRIDCENNDAKNAVPLTIEMIRKARRVVRPDGCLVLWSAGMHEDRPEIIIAAREAGWRVGFAGFWKKHLTQPCDFSWPWTTCVERFLVLYPVGGEAPFDHSQELSRADVITPDDLDPLAACKSPSQMAHADFVSGRKKIGDVHMFQKGVPLCAYFLAKLTKPGDQVVDLFACSGDMCIAAEQAKRPWTYIELDPTNYKWGVGRIADAKNQLLAA
jgi:hypothetical protein